MPRGSPDHTDRVHQEHCRYDNVRLISAWAAVPTLPVWREVINVDAPGMFGYLWCHSDNPYMYCRVTLDGVHIFMMHPWNVRVIGGYGYSNHWNKMGVGRWDEIDDDYNFIYDEEWAMVFNKNITVELAYELGQAGNGSCLIWYKLLHP